jgi:hypothetical protein
MLKTGRPRGVFRDFVTSCFRKNASMFVTRRNKIKLVIKKLFKINDFINLIYNYKCIDRTIYETFFVIIYIISLESK